MTKRTQSVRGSNVYAGDTEDTSVLLVDTVEDSSSPRGFFPQKRVVSMQFLNWKRQSFVQYTFVDMF